MELPDSIFQKMSEDEKTHLVCLSLCGFRQGDMVLMGKEAYDRYNNYIAQMIEKYSTKYIDKRVNKN